VKTENEMHAEMTVISWMYYMYVKLMDQLSYLELRQRLEIEITTT